MARTSTASSTEVLAGLVDRVTFHNPENGFCVLRVKARGQRDLITVIGHAAMISAGEFGATFRFETISLPSWR
jgi:exodeoxyribonuclease V alpha subunit